MGGGNNLIGRCQYGDSNNCRNFTHDENNITNSDCANRAMVAGCENQYLWTEN